MWLQRKQLYANAKWLLAVIMCYPQRILGKNFFRRMICIFTGRAILQIDNLKNHKIPIDNHVTM